MRGEIPQNLTQVHHLPREELGNCEPDDVDRLGFHAVAFGQALIGHADRN
jgi:hypothetical protein